MKFLHLPFRSSLEAYHTQAEQLLQARNAGDADAIRIFREHLPRFLDEKIPWLPKKMTEAEVHGITLDLSDARLAIARWHCFLDWAALTQYVDSVTRDDSPSYSFESAVESLITGDAEGLKHWLCADPRL